VAGLTISTTKPALAEFEIQESQVEKGEVELRPFALTKPTLHRHLMRKP
jgi:hypothetical protein